MKPWGIEKEFLSLSPWTPFQNSNEKNDSFTHKKRTFERVKKYDF
jgi:hypothetical protein